MYDLNAMLNKGKSLLDKGGIPYGKIFGIKVNNRLSRRWGRCIRKTGSSGYWIELRKILADDTVTSEKGIMDVILHEMIHTCEGCWNHGTLFNEYGKRLEKYGYDTQGSTTSAEKLQLNMVAYTENMRYAVQCPVCKYTIYRDRMCDMIRYPEFYAHTKCGKSFVRIK